MVLKTATDEPIGVIITDWGEFPVYREDLHSGVEVVIRQAEATTKKGGEA